MFAPITIGPLFNFDPTGALKYPARAGWIRRIVRADYTQVTRVPDCEHKGGKESTRLGRITKFKILLQSGRPSISMRHSGLRRYNASLKVASERPRVLLLKYMSVVAVAHTGRKMSRFDCEFIRFSRSEIIRLASLARVPDVLLWALGVRHVSPHLRDKLRQALSCAGAKSGKRRRISE